MQKVRRAMARGAVFLITIILVASAIGLVAESRVGQITTTTTTVTDFVTTTDDTMSVPGAGPFSPNVVVFLQSDYSWETDIHPSIEDLAWYAGGANFEGMSLGNSDCLACVDLPPGTNFTVDAHYGVMPTSWYRSGSVNITSVKVDAISLYPKGVFTIESANATWPFVASTNNATITVALRIMCPDHDYSGSLVIDSNMTALTEYNGSSSTGT